MAGTVRTTVRVSPFFGQLEACVLRGGVLALDVHLLCAKIDVRPTEAVDLCGTHADERRHADKRAHREANLGVPDLERAVAQPVDLGFSQNVQVLPATASSEPQS